jgi:MurNAc alpha-1-phosphate uridylyltransferase
MNLPRLAVLAGGVATRLRPITEKIPKSLVQVADEPFIAHQLRLVFRQGFRHVVLLTGHLGEQIEAFVGNGSRFGLEVIYCSDGARLRGTGGALRAAARHLGDEVFVLYGDSYLDIEVEPVYAAFRASGATALMTVLHNRDRWDQSNVVFDGALVRRHDKTARGQSGVEWIDYGLSILRSSTLIEWPHPDPFDLSAVTSELAVKGQLAGFEVFRRFHEIGTPKGRAETEDYIIKTRHNGACQPQVLRTS